MCECVVVVQNGYTHNDTEEGMVQCFVNVSVHFINTVLGNIMRQSLALQAGAVSNQTTRIFYSSDFSVKLLF